MRTGINIILFFLFTGCGAASPVAPDIPFPQNPQQYQSEHPGTYVPWGYYQLEIARDGSSYEIVPSRSTALYTYGTHLNALKLLEGGPCDDCVSVSNAHMTPEGNVSVDISITHPYDNPVYTGFDVRGIIMFPASQYVPDDDLRALAGKPPFTGNISFIFSSSEKGDTELVNTEGWTRMWEPGGNNGIWTETGYPIFEYHHGNYASGQNIGNMNPFKRFYSNENRHMFEVGETVTRTYIIKPPAEGPIEACYAVYAHWAEPDVIPVTDPATDFPLIANSVLPYELEFYQDGVIDPDAPPEVQAEQIHILLKHWGVIPMQEDTWDWDLTQADFIEMNLSVALEPHPSGIPDEYWPTTFDPGYYDLIPDVFPGTWPFSYSVIIHDPIAPGGLGVVAKDYWIMDIEFGALDGQW